MGAWLDQHGAWTCSQHIWFLICSMHSPSYWRFSLRPVRRWGQGESFILFHSTDRLMFDGIKTHKIYLTDSHRMSGWKRTIFTTNWTPIVDIGCLCTSCCLMWRFFSDYFSCFLSRLIRWFVTFVLHCFSLFGLFVVLQFLAPGSLLVRLWHWAQGLYYVAFPLKSSFWHWAQVPFCGLS